MVIFKFDVKVIKKIITYTSSTVAILQFYCTYKKDCTTGAGVGNYDFTVQPTENYIFYEVGFSY